MTTIVVIMMMVDDMEEYNDKDAWFVYFFNLYNQDDHGQVRSCKPVEVPSTQKVCHQVPHQACHQVSFVATLLVFRCHQFLHTPNPNPPPFKCFFATNCPPTYHPSDLSLPFITQFSTQLSNSSKQEPYQSCHKVPSTVPVKMARQVKFIFANICFRYFIRCPFSF